MVWEICKCENPSIHSRCLNEEGVGAGEAQAASWLEWPFLVVLVVGQGGVGVGKAVAGVGGEVPLFGNPLGL